MFRKIKNDSFIYHFLITAHDLCLSPISKTDIVWGDFLRELRFENSPKGIVVIWENCTSGEIEFQLDRLVLYSRGDTQLSYELQHQSKMLLGEDPIKLSNNEYFKDAVLRVAEEAGYEIRNKIARDRNEQYDNEKEFHDVWANSENVEIIDVLHCNEVCTAPEMRYIVKRLGKLEGKRVLDVGCGLGEASVYFALLGAEVTSSDISQGMLDATTRLAKMNNVNIKQHISSAESLHLAEEDKFDIIYAGNLLHHVNIEETIICIKKHLDINGVFVSWDPLAYNPAINIYRSMATDVRTLDEHPFKWSDIKIFHKHFKMVETKYFWLTTLVIFVIMTLVQLRHPNKERFWKVVVEEGNKWSWLYNPLEKVDNFLLGLFPPLRMLCWNVVIFSKSKI